MTALTWGRWRTVLRLSLIVLVSACSAFAVTDKCIVKTASRSNEATVLDVGPAVPQSDGYGGTYEVAGMHGWVLKCNNDQSTCSMPHTGDSGYIEEHDKKEEVYDGENVKIRWANGAVSIYALKETY